MITASRPMKLPDYNKEYRVIALDLDGTLTNSRKEVSPRNKEAIRKAVEKGVHVVLASGRPLPGVAHVARDVGLFDFGGYMLAYNGSQVVDCITGRSLIHETLPEKYYPEICRFYRDFGINLMTYTETGVISENREQYTELESGISKIPLTVVPDLLSAIGQPVCKFLAAGSYDNLRTYQDYLKEIFGCTREELIACGDSMNDTTMVSFAGLGVAMENAQPHLKSQADYIADTNDNDGVAEVIEKFILHEW